MVENAVISEMYLDRRDYNNELGKTRVRGDFSRSVRQCNVRLTFNLGDNTGNNSENIGTVFLDHKTLRPID